MMRQADADAASLAAWFRASAPPGTATAVAPIIPLPAGDAAEEACLARAVPHRCAEFRTGRLLARAALARIACAPCALPPDTDRVPAWPRGYVGSISHGAGLCAAEVGSDAALLGIGIDIEASGAVDPALAGVIATPDEWAELTLRLPCREAASLCFSAKEAFHKAWFPATRRHLDFREVRVSVDGDRFEVSLAAPAVPSLGGRRSWQGDAWRTPQHVAAALRIPR